LKQFAIGCALMMILGIAPRASAQFTSKLEASTIVGSVLLDDEAQPAAGVRVDVRSIGGGEIATTFTDPSGHFEVPAHGSRSVILTVEKQGFEPAEQQVDPALAGSTPVIIALRKTRATSVDRAGYKVSVNELKVPGKARREFEKGLEHLQKQDVEGGLEHFKAATKAFPDYYEAYYQIGLADMKLLRRSDAEQALEKAIDLSGGRSAEPQVALGGLLCDQKAYPEAERVLRRAIEVDRDSWTGHFFLGQALFGENRLAEAEKSAREVLMRRSDVPSVYVLLANIHIRKREYALAVKNLDTYLSMKPDGPIADEARGVRAAAARTALNLASKVVLPRFVY
jgi:tetratricopeptide (TPR) repeat protein